MGREPAAREGIAADIVVERPVPEERHRGGRATASMRISCG